MEKLGFFWSYIGCFNIMNVHFALCKAAGAALASAVLY
jgi:hypothetical protein